MLASEVMKLGDIVGYLNALIERVALEAARLTRQECLSRKVNNE